MADVIFAATDAETHLTPLRRFLAETGGTSPIRPGILFARILAPDSFVLRQSLILIMAYLNGAAPSKTWIL